MRIIKNLAMLFMLVPVLAFVAGCGSPTQGSSQEGTVQDIQPGDQSIIQPPSQTTPAIENRLEERAI